MTAPDIALQTAVRDRLISEPAITSHVPADYIRAGGLRPEKFAGIIFTGAQTVPEGEAGHLRSSRVFLDLHVWTGEGEELEARTIAHEVRTALSEPLTVSGFEAWGNFWVTGARSIPDPQGYGHVVISIEAMMTEVLQ